ncbi:hypothetical protein [Streptomyces sp. NPDC088725]|uniref:hypothetical protein n=1 Tax=Streptomyces sp. NPDC088725 TaxID=3365873 RepID=UPI00382414E3
MTTSRQRKFRSSAVVLGGMGMLAVTLTSCGSEPDKRCIDPVTYKTLPKYECSDNGHGHYYYGGTVRNGRVSGGSTNKSAVDSGGFGGHHSSSHSGSHGG